MKTNFRSQDGAEQGSGGSGAGRLGQIKLALAGCRSGRLILHAACLCRHPSHASWHWRGMLRELAA